MRGNSAGSLRARLARRALLGGHVQPLRRDVGRIGLDHQRLQRQVGGQAADLQRALEGHRAAEAQLEAQLDEGQRLLRAAVEGVRDAAGTPVDAAQLPEQRVGRAAHVQDHRQAGAARQLELRA